MPEYKAKILLVEDDPTLSYVIKDSLNKNQFDVVHCPDGETGWAQFMKHNFDICLLDVMLPKKRWHVAGSPDKGEK